ncbi:MAG: XdhC family protein [Anaerovoracaceae bacterium]|jgi:xanthine dehydrogenase accessory factor
MNKITRIARDLIEDNEDFVIAKIVDTHGSTPRSKGAILLMRQNGDKYGSVGGGSLEAAVEKICKETFNTKKSEIHHFHLNSKDQINLDMRCGGDADVSIEYISADQSNTFNIDYSNLPVAYIFGGGHVGKAIEPLLRYVDFATVVLDDREEYANKERFPEADRIVVLNNYVEAYKDIRTDENSYIVIVTRGHRGDYEVLKNAMKNPAAYIGMIGSKKKVTDMLNRLRTEGFSDKEIEKIYSPIGLSIYAETPEEIAVSVVAEMIMVRAGYGK